MSDRDRPSDTQYKQVSDEAVRQRLEALSERLVKAEAALESQRAKTKDLGSEVRSMKDLLRELGKAFGNYG